MDGSKPCRPDENVVDENDPTPDLEWVLAAVGPQDGHEEGVSVVFQELPASALSPGTKLLCARVEDRAAELAYTEVEAAWIVAGSSLLSLIVSRIRCILRPGQTPCFQSGCSDQPLEARGDEDSVVHEYALGGHEVLVVAHRNE